MSIVLNNTNKPLLLNWLLQATSSPEALTLKLFKNNYSATATDTTSSYTEADFTGYSSSSVTRSGWSNASGGSGTATSNYGSTLTWTNSGSSQTVYGYFLVGSSSGNLYWSETWGASRTLATSDVLNFVPQLQLN